MHWHRHLVRFLFGSCFRCSLCLPPFPPLPQDLSGIFLAAPALCDAALGCAECCASSDPAGNLFASLPQARSIVRRCSCYARCLQLPVSAPCYCACLLCCCCFSPFCALLAIVPPPSLSLSLSAFPPSSFNVSHRIDAFSFGEPFPGIVNPLDKVERMMGLEDGGGMYMSAFQNGAQKHTAEERGGTMRCERRRGTEMHVASAVASACSHTLCFCPLLLPHVPAPPRYYVKVVPTTYESRSSGVLNTNQFSVTEHFRPLSSREGQGLPGVFFFYGQRKCARIARAYTLQMNAQGAYVSDETSG